MAQKIQKLYFLEILKISIDEMNNTFAQHIYPLNLVVRHLLSLGSISNFKEHCQNIGGQMNGDRSGT